MQRQRKPTRAYWQAYGALYGENMDIPPRTPVTPAKPKKKRRRDEEVEQEKFNVWFDRFLWGKGFRWFHPANEGRRDAIEGAKFRRLGVKAGVPDIICPVARSPYHGLVIELKKVDGKYSDVRTEQKDWLNWFAAQHWAAHVAYGFEHAKSIIISYLELPEWGRDCYAKIQQ